MLGKKRESPQIDAAVGRGVDYEIALADVVRKSERRAWRVAFSAVAMALILAAGYFFLLPLKERTPYLVVNDVYSGASTVARLEGNIGAVTMNEAVTRSNIARYINARESYDSLQYSMRDRRAVYAMSTEDVASEYAALYSPKNPDSLVSRYGKTKAIRVEIISIVPLGNGFSGNAVATGEGQGDAQVRFKRLLLDKTNGMTTVLDTKLATLRYQYNKDLRLNDRESIENPLRFQVVSYRVDTEAATTNLLPKEVSDENHAVQQPAAVLPPAAVPGVPGAREAGAVAPPAATPPPSQGAARP